MTTTRPEQRTAVIGAGLAGLTCAAALQAAGVAVTVFDKARGPGGRMSTRRLALPDGDVAFDHGATAFTVRDPAFQVQVEQWVSAGRVAPWPPAGPDAYVGTPAMNAPLKALAAGLDGRFGQAVTVLTRQGDGWRIAGPDGVDNDLFDQVLLAIPAEQAAVLLAPVRPDFAALAAATPSSPCWTLMAVFSQPVATDLTLVRGDDAVALACCDGDKPGRTGRACWVVQASPAWSLEHLERSADEIAGLLLAALSERLATPLPPALSASAHRWRYARPTPQAHGALWAPDIGLGVCGDWLDGGDVEGAWRSGRRLAALTLTP